MRIHFRAYPPEVRELDKRIISVLLSAHYKAAVLALVTGGATPEEADLPAIRSVDAFAKESFPDFQIDALPDADQ